MPSLKLADAIVYYQPNQPDRGRAPPDTLVVAHRNNHALDRDFSMSWDIARQSLSSDMLDRLIYLLRLSRYLTVKQGASAKSVDGALMEIDEYAEIMTDE